MPKQDIKLDFSYQNLGTLPQQFRKNGYENVFEIDLSFNFLSEVDFLRFFPNVSIVILECNKLEGNTVFPKLPKLHTLWMNDNLINDVHPLIKNLESHCPHLKFLSLQNNPGVPNMKSGSAKTDFLQYRYFIISKFPALLCLDGESVTRSELMNAWETCEDQSWIQYFRFKYSIFTHSNADQNNAVI